MMIVQFLVVIVLSLFVSSAAWIKKGAAGNTNGYLQRRYISDDDSNDFHRVSIAVKSKNMDVLEQLLMNVSNPNHVDYGKHWTKKRIGNLIRNDAAIRAIKNHLLNEDATIISETPNGETIEAQATIRTWSRIFNTNFYEFESKTDTKKKLIRALEYSIPPHLNPHIDSVFGLVEFPVVFGGQPIIEPIPDTRRSLRSDEISVQGSKFVTPAVFSNTYGISSNTGNGLTTQSAFSCIGQTMSTTDLTTFQQYFGIPVQGLSKSYGGHVKANACSSVGLENCAEANLDFQYLMGISRSVPTISLYEASCDYATFFQSLTDPPKVISISYASIESSMGSATLRRFNNVAIQLGVMGVTIVVASGDDGAAGFNVRDGTESCAYNPFFPASSPYVLAVGATQGPELGATEVACQSDTGGVITSGGGFSVYNSIPSWQANAVSSYFSKVSRPVAGYNTNGRGYPDISALGHAYLTFLAGQGYSLSGTSASSPSVAAMLSLINSARKAIGKSTLGFVNPLLYTYSSNFVRDITQGNNYCTANPSKCCSQGFVATSGWDPVTGLGVLDYQSFYNFAVGFNSFTPSASPASVPTIPPTNAPTLADGETYAPTETPTETPTVTPTRTPSKSPTPSPTKVPSRRPTAKPTRVPTKSPTPKPTRTTSKPTKRPTFQPFL